MIGFAVGVLLVKSFGAVSALIIIVAGIYLFDV